MERARSPLTRVKEQKNGKEDIKDINLKKSARSQSASTSLTRKPLSASVRGTFSGPLSSGDHFHFSDSSQTS